MSPELELALDDIRVDALVCQRAKLSGEVVREWAEEGVPDTAVVVFLDDDGVHWLADGFHRVAALRQAGHTRAPAVVHLGSRRDAILYACAANLGRGVRASREDKRRAVMTLLEDPEWSQWSDREIGRRCGVSHPFVAKLRRPPAARSPAPPRRAPRDAAPSVPRKQLGEPERPPVEPDPPAPRAANPTAQGPVGPLRRACIAALKARREADALAKTLSRATGDALTLRAQAATAWRAAQRAEKRVRETPLEVLAIALGITEEELSS